MNTLLLLVLAVALGQVPGTELREHAIAFAELPAECAAERNAAQQLYAEAMELLEASERRIVKDEKALRLLVENRGKWHWQGGRVVWSDAALANEFEYFRRDPSPVQKRRAAVIESPIVRIPANR